MIYMRMDEAYKAIKVGITSDKKGRDRHYDTMNPFIKTLEEMDVGDKKADRIIEAACHKEMEARGFQQVVGEHGVRTEWYILNPNQFRKFKEKGFKALNTTKYF